MGTTAKVLGISANSYSICAQFNDDTFKCWGYNEHGQLGLGDTNDRGDNPNEMGDDLPTVSFP